MAIDPEELSHLVRRSAAEVTLTRPVLCARCLYDLRGLPGGGLCPECGQAYCAVGPRPMGVYRRERVFVSLSGVILTAFFGCVCWSMFNGFGGPATIRNSYIAGYTTWLHTTFCALCGATALLCAWLTFIQARRYVEAQRRWRDAQRRRSVGVEEDGPWIAVPSIRNRDEQERPSLASTLRATRGSAPPDPASPSAAPTSDRIMSPSAKRKRRP